jgi:GAF domain-containing protein
MSQINLLALNQQAGIKTAEALLESAFSQILAAVSGAKTASVYRLARGGLVLWQSSDKSAQVPPFLPLDSSPYQDAITRGQSILHAQQAIVPLSHSAEPFALLLLDFEKDASLETLSDIAQDLSILLYQRQLEALFSQQIEVTSQLNAADSLQAVAAVLANTILQSEQYIAMIVFEANNKGRVVVTANRRQVFPQNISTGINADAVSIFHQLLETEGEALISDSETDSRFSSEAQKWLQEQAVKSMYMLPLQVSKRLYGFIGLVDTVRSLAPSPLEKQLYRNIAVQASSVIEKRQFLDEAQRTMAASSEEARSLQLLNRLIATANTANTEAPIFQQTTEALLEVTGVDHVGIVMIEGERGFVVSETPIKGMLGVEVESGPDSVAALLRTSRKPLIVADVEADTTMPVDGRKTLHDLGIQSVIILPMFDLDSNLIGTVGLDYFTKQERINPNTVELAQTFVSQVALSLQKLRLLANSQQQAAQLQKVTNFGQALRSHLGVAEIVGTALRYSHDLLEAHYVGILVYESRQLRRVGTWWEKQSQIAMDAPAIDNESDSIALKVLESLELQSIQELQAEWVWKHPHDKELQSFMATPLLSAGRFLGVLEVGNTKARAYNTVDVAAFQQMGNQVAVALSNAEAYAQTQKVARHKSLANEIITKLQRQADVGEILQVTVQELGEALGAKRGRIRLGTGDIKKQ